MYYGVCMQSLVFSWAPERIDTWLVKQFPYSRNFFHHIIERKGIFLNGKPAKKSAKLKAGDQIEIDNLERYLSPVILEEAPSIEIPIVRETADYLVINKPKWVLSHPNSIWEVGKPSVVGFLYHHYKELPSIGNFIRAGLLHRLDKDTDGLMIIAKTEVFSILKLFLKRNLNLKPLSKKTKFRSKSDIVQFVKLCRRERGFWMRLRGSCLLLSVRKWERKSLMPFQSSESRRLKK